MGFFNDKWNNSSALPKVALCTMLLNTLLLLIGALVILSWEKMLGASYGYYILFLIAFLYNALLSFGLFKVNGIARGFTILEGLGSVLVIVLFIAGYKYAIAATREAAAGLYGETAVDAAGAAIGASAGLIGGLLQSILPALLSLIPPKVLGMIGLYLIIFIGPCILQLLSMLILFVCGKDFKKIKKEQLQPVS
jgi:hypothetical protein